MARRCARPRAQSVSPASRTAPATPGKSSARPAPASPPAAPASHATPVAPATRATCAAVAPASRAARAPTCAAAAARATRGSRARAASAPPAGPAAPCAAGAAVTRASCARAASARPAEPAARIAAANSACSSGNACVGGKCSACGASGETCCAGSTCKSGLACESGKCAACGTSGEALLPWRCMRLGAHLPERQVREADLRRERHGLGCNGGCLSALLSCENNTCCTTSTFDVCVSCDGTSTQYNVDGSWRARWPTRSASRTRTWRARRPVARRSRAPAPDRSLAAGARNNLAPACRTALRRTDLPDPGTGKTPSPARGEHERCCILRGWALRLPRIARLLRDLAPQAAPTLRASRRSSGFVLFLWAPPRSSRSSPAPAAGDDTAYSGDDGGGTEGGGDGAGGGPDATSAGDAGHHVDSGGGCPNACPCTAMGPPSTCSAAMDLGVLQPGQMASRAAHRARGL